MKKYFLILSISINFILLAALIAVIIMFFDMKGKATAIIEQVKSGEYADLVEQNTGILVPDSLKNLKPIETEGDQCKYFYEKVDTAIEYLKDNPEIMGAETYSEQLSTLKNTIEKTPSVFKDTACEKGISSLNYVIETILPTEK